MKTCLAFLEKIEDVVYVEAATERFPWGDPQIERRVKVVLLRRWQFGVSFTKPLKVRT